MKRFVAVILFAVSSSVPGVAWADHGGYEEGCGRNGGCNNEREEEYNGAGCKYVCPSFDKSPVHDAFNFGPQICMPGATCHFDDKQQKEGEQPSE